jgi:type IX secretion system PorP/SprF family membrane protein
VKAFRQTYRTLIGLFLALAANGQDMQFSQSYSNPIYLNPAFAGNQENTRIVLNYRDQWPGIKHNFKAYAASTDFYMKPTKGGLGVSVMKDVAGEHNLSNTIASLYYAQHIRLSRKSNLSLGIKGSMGQRAFDPGNLLFADQVIRESTTSLSQPVMAPATLYADFSAGILYYTDKSWFGVSLHRINEPNQSLLGGTDIIPRKLSVHGGTIVPIESFKRSLGEKKLRVAFNYKSQGEWDQLDVGGFFTYRHVNFGMWYRGLPIKPYKPGYLNNESVILLIGYEAPKWFSFGYSYDISINRLFTHSGGAHEISMILEIPQRKKQKRRVVPCAKF